MNEIIVPQQTWDDVVYCILVLNELVNENFLTAEQMERYRYCMALMESAKKTINDKN